MRLTAAPRVGWHKELIGNGFIMEPVVHAGHHPNRVTKRWVRRYIIYPFTVNVNFSAVFERFDVLITGHRQVGVCWLRAFCSAQLLLICSRHTGFLSIT